jgi:hypothetical protein
VKKDLSKTKRLYFTLTAGNYLVQSEVKTFKWIKLVLVLAYRKQGCTGLHQFFGCARNKQAVIKLIFPPVKSELILIGEELTESQRGEN